MGVILVLVTKLAIRITNKSGIQVINFGLITEWSIIQATITIKIMA